MAFGLGTDHRCGLCAAKDQIHADATAGSDGDVKRSISYTGGVVLPSDDPEAVVHLDLLAAILSRLDPELPVAVAEYGRARMAIFGVGVLSIIAAIAMFALAIGTGISGDRLMAAAMPFGLLLLLGVSFAWSSAPWRPIPTLSAKALARSLTRIAHPEKDLGS